MTTISIDTVTEFIGRAMSPLADELTNDAAIVSFVRRLGWELPSAPPSLGLVHDAAAALQQALGSLSAARRASDDAAIASAFAEVGATFGVVVGNLEDLEDALHTELPATFLAESGIAPALKRRIVDFALIRAIRSTSFLSEAILISLGVLEENKLSADPSKHQPAFTLREFRTDRLSAFLNDPSSVLSDVYGWGTPEIQADRLYRTVDLLSLGLLAPSEPAYPSLNLLNSMFSGAPEGTVIQRMLNIPLGGLIEVALLPAPSSTPGDPQPLALRLVGTPQASFQFGLGLGLQLNLAVEAALDTGIGVLLRPGEPPGLLVGIESSTSGALTGGRIGVSVSRREPEVALRVLELPGVSLDLGDLDVGIDLEASPADLVLRAGIVGGRLSIALGPADGFLRSVVPSESLVVEFDVGVGWSKRRGLFLTGAAGLETVLQVNLTLGPVFIDAVRLAILASGDGIRLGTGVEMGVELGPVTAIVQGIGAEALLEFEAGNLGPLNLSSRFVRPTGAGILVDAGAVRGGGFLYFDFDADRYAGVIELSVFTLAVKAFGLIDTKLPDGSDGFSFVIIISAEFTPIQLGWGSPLPGGGGMVGVNRTVNAEALGAAARTGSLAHLLFPKNPVRDAPAIVHDLATVFPAAKGHYIFAPMAKLGWGTPTLITADIGVLLEFPGPRLGLLGVVRAQLPKPDVALLNLQMAVAGLLDFPAKTLSVDAGLFDSRVVGYTVTGDMAYRLGFGNKPKFLMSIGGFNPSFDAAPAFPELNRAAVDVGINGNPSLTISGYFAITSNTAQLGAEMRLVAKKYGVKAEGSIGFDALFVFSPFSFRFEISARISVKFHGVGKSVTLRGALTGPSPYHFTGKACVSVAWWDACLPVDIRFGKDNPASLPEINPWLGAPNADPRLAVRGLQEAVQDPRSWSGSTPPAGFAVVSLSEAATLERTPIDPLGAATMRQTVAPLGVKLERFGAYKPVGPDLFALSVVVLNGTTVLEEEIEVVQEAFPPAHYLNLDAAERLSMESYVDEDAGFSIAPERLTAGSVGSQVMRYETAYINAEGDRFGDQPLHVLSRDLLKGLLRSSASALGGVARAGARKYIQPNTAKRVTFGPKRFVVVDACSSLRNSDITATETSQTRATLALRSHVTANPADRGRFAVAPLYAAAS